MGVHAEGLGSKQTGFTRRIVVSGLHRQDEMGVLEEGLGNRLLSQGLW